MFIPCYWSQFFLKLWPRWMLCSSWSSVRFGSRWAEKEHWDVPLGPNCESIPFIECLGCGSDIKVGAAAEGDDHRTWLPGIWSRISELFELSLCRDWSWYWVGGYIGMRNSWEEELVRWILWDDQNNLRWQKYGLIFRSPAPFLFTSSMLWIAWFKQFLLRNWCSHLQSRRSWSLIFHCARLPSDRSSRRRILKAA